MRLLAWTVLCCLFGLPLALVAAAWLAVDERPAVERAVAFTPEHVERARRIVEANDPRALRAGAERSVTLPQGDVDLAANYLAGRYANGSARVVLHGGHADVFASLALPPNPLGRYLNLSAVLGQTDALPRLESLRLGRLPVPAPLADALLGFAVRRLDTRGGARLASDTIRHVAIAEGRLEITYAWQADSAQRIREAMLSPGESERLHAYQALLAQAVPGLRAGTAGSVALADLLAPLFEEAARRAAGGDPVAENRASIVVAAFYVNGRGLGAVVPEARGWPRPPRRAVALAGRGDFAQHFTISAAIAAHAGTPLADAIGLYKEVDDMRRGSGFSFNDIAADRAGTRFGELAAGSRASAARLQREVGSGLRDADLMPAVADLPEFMRQAEFERRYGGIGAPAWRRTMDDIEARIAALPLYR
jgi:hypothetical protein